VTEFTFTNPHAIIEITRKTPQGPMETWRARRMPSRCRGGAGGRPKASRSRR
jgi:hypothetical protein